MTTTDRDVYEADTRVAAAESKMSGQFNALKSTASDVLASPYVRGAAVLGIAAAGYALVKRKNPGFRIRRRNAAATPAIT